MAFLFLPFLNEAVAAVAVLLYNIHTIFFHSSNNTTNDNLYDFLILLPCVFVVQNKRKNVERKFTPDLRMCTVLCRIYSLILSRI